MAGPGGWTTAKEDFFIEGDNHKFGSTFYQITTTELKKTPLRTQDDFDSVINAPMAEGAIHLIESGGERIACLGISESFMAQLCASWFVPAIFVEKLLTPGPLPLLVHHFELMKGASGLKLHGASFGFRWGLGHSQFMICFGRYDFKKEALCMVVSSTGLTEPVARKSCKQLGISTSADIVLRLKTALQEEPLSFIGNLLQVCQRYVAIHTQECNLAMLRGSASLDSLLAPDLKGWTRNWGLRPLDSSNSKTKIVMLYSNYNSVIWGEKACSDLINLGKRYLQIAEDAKSTYQNVLPTTLVQEVVHQAELRSHMYAYLIKAITTQFTHQYNWLVQKDTEASIEISNASKDIAVATRRDSLAMKTVAYLTLAFLPAAFVSAIFSTTIFDFQKMHSKENSGRVVSPGWWIFVVLVLLATLITLGVWRVWQVKKVKEDDCQRAKTKAQSHDREDRQIA
jgi:hypothetical protein